MLENARYTTKFVKDKRTAELFEHDNKMGYTIRLIEDGKIIEDRFIEGKSLHYIVDACENWCNGIISA